MKSSITIGIVAVLLSLSMIPLQLGSDGDITIVFAGEIKDHHTTIMINKTDERVILNYSVEFILISYYHTDLRIYFGEHLGNITDFGSNSKWLHIIDADEDGVLFRFKPSNISNNEVRCNFWINIDYSGIDGINITRESNISKWEPRLLSQMGWDNYILYMENHQWTRYSIPVINSSIEIFSDINVTVSSPNHTYNNTGPIIYCTNVTYYKINNIYQASSNYFSSNKYPLKIQWGEGDIISEEKEFCGISLSSKYWKYIGLLIVREDVDISIDLSQKNLSYTIEAGFVINRTVYNNLNPQVWFPENGTDCSAVFHFELPDNDSNFSLEASCTPDQKEDQKGFSIQIPYEIKGERIILDEDPILNVTIKGTLVDPWFDFTIVTIPLENSSIRITTPRLFDIEVGRNPFELIDRHYTFENNILEFHGRCLQYGKLHLLWENLTDSDGDLVPDIVDQLPFDRNETIDTDRDGFGDGIDQFPLDKKEWKDTDDDGWGDNCDAFPQDPLEWNDTDGDGWGDNIDQFPNDPSETIDTDGDGVGDNEDYYPTDPYRWEKEEKDHISVHIINVSILLLVISAVLLMILRKRKRILSEE